MANKSAKKSIQYAGFWVRAAAIIIDAIVIQIGLGFPLYLIFSKISGQNFGYFEQKPSIVNNLGVILFITATVFFVTRFGATPGKMFYGLKILTPKNEYPSMGKTLLREIIGKTLSLILFFLGYVWAGFDREKQSFHDKIAETHVVVTKPIDGFKKFTIFAIAFLLPMIPLLVIIALLTLVAINPLKKISTAKDVQRKSDIGMLAAPLETFKQKNDRYPDSLSELKALGTITYIPKDPAGGMDYFYLSSSDGSKAVLYARLEKGKLSKNSVWCWKTETKSAKEVNSSACKL